MPVSLLCRLSYAIYSWLFAGVRIDPKCNEQIHTKMSQQSHSICFTSSSEMVLTENIFQKLSIIDTPRNYSGQAGTLGGHSAPLVWQSFSFVMFILLQCNQDYPFKFTFILVMAWMRGKIYRMDEIENTANFMSCLLPV